MTERRTLTPELYAQIAHAIEAELAKVIVGQRDLVRGVVTCLLSEGHALLEGVPGLGKTMLLKTLADAIDVEFSRVQFTPDLMPADIVGTQVLETKADGNRDFEFRPGPVFANLVLADEVNRATPKTQSALLEAMQERSVTVAGATRPLPRPFLVMATQNPLEMEGTYPLPEAQLDRFLLKLHVPLPPADDLVTILERTTGGAPAHVSAVANAQTLSAMVELTRQVPVADPVLRYAVDVVVATHREGPSPLPVVSKYVRFGSSPRGAQALILAGKATALLDGRPNVSVDDIKTVASAALRHRLILGYEAVADGVTADQIVAEILSEVAPAGAGLRGAPNQPLLDAGFLGRLERLQVRTRRPLSGRLSGEHRSTRHGTSLDFADYREYHPGDDYRRIDYHLLARLDVLALKLFEADDDLQVRLLIDTSASMQTGGKMLQAQRLAAALGFVSLVRRDAVSVHTISHGGIGSAAPRFSGRNAAASLFRYLEQLTPAGPTPFVATVADLLARPGPRGLTIVFSDLLTPDWEAAINRLPARGGDVLIVHVLDAEELDPTHAGDFDLIDSESGTRVPVSLSDQTRDEYRTIVSNWLDDVALRCRSVDAGYVLVLADEDIEPLLLARWREDGLLA